MKVSIAIKRIASRTGGAEKIATDIANELCRLSYDVEIVHYENSDEPPVFSLDKRVKYFNIKNNRRYEKNNIIYILLQVLGSFFKLNFSKIPWVIKYGTFISRIKKHYEFEEKCVIIALLPDMFPYVICALEGVHSKKVVASVHNAPERDFLDKGRWDSSTYDRKYRLSCLAKCYAVTTLLPSFEFFFANRNIKNVHVIENMVTLAGVEAGGEVGNGYTTYISVGRFVPHKRMDCVIKAFYKLSLSHSNCKLIMCGDGPELSRCKEICKLLDLGNNVDLIGNTNNVEKYYSMSDVFVTASEYEGFGLTTVESFYYGLPAIGFEDCPGTNEIIKHKYNGILVKSNPDPIENLYMAMLGLMIDANELAALSENAKSSYDEFRPGKIVKKWEKLIDSAYEKDI